MAEVRTVQIITTFRTGMPSVTDLYQPGTISTANFTGGRWAGKIIQLQLLTDNRAVNAISLSVEDESRAEYTLLEEVRVIRTTSPLDLMPLLGYEKGFYMSASHVLKANVVYPQNVGDSYLTVAGFAIETKDSSLSPDLILDGGLYDGI